LGAEDDRLSNIVEIQIYGRATCARRTLGDVYCWGDQYDVDDDIDERSRDPEHSSDRPRKVEGAETIARLSGKRNPFRYNTAVRGDGEIVTWSGVDLRPFVKIGQHSEEKQDPDDFIRILPRDDQKPQKAPSDFQPWHARRSGTTVEAIELFADTGCFYGAGLLSCPGVVKGVDLPNYDALDWRYEPGVVDIAIFEWDYSEVGVCLQFTTGRLECRLGGERTQIELPSPPRKLFGGSHLIVLLEDGRIASIERGMTVALIPEASGIVDLDVSASGIMCGVLDDGGGACWIYPSRRWTRIAMAGIENATSVQISDGFKWCVLYKSRQVECGGWDDSGPTLRLERAGYVLAPVENGEK